MFDLAIIGAGPAGTTFARLVAGRYKVLLVDKRPFDNAADTFGGRKCCGGLLAPDAQRMLSELELGLPKHVLQTPQLFVVKVFDSEQHLEEIYQRHYINLDRRAFDSWLLSLVPDTVDIRRNTRFTGYSRSNTGFQLTLRGDAGTYTEEAKVLVGADGANSRVRSQNVSNHARPKQYIAIQEWFSTTCTPAHFTVVFDRRITDYYSWAIPKADHVVIGAALEPRRQTRETFDQLKEILRTRGFSLGKPVWREGTYLLRPGIGRSTFLAEDGIACLGEAAAWISPSSAEGISYAFRSACALAQALQTGPEGFEARYRRLTRPLKRNVFMKCLKSYCIFTPASRRLLMASGMQTVRPYRQPSE